VVGAEAELIQVKAVEAKQKVDLVVLEAVHGMLAQLAVPVLRAKVETEDPLQAAEALSPMSAVVAVEPELLDLMGVVDQVLAAPGHNHQ